MSSCDSCGGDTMHMKDCPVGKRQLAAFERKLDEAASQSKANFALDAARRQVYFEDNGKIVPPMPSAMHLLKKPEAPPCTVSGCRKSATRNWKCEDHQ